MRHLLHLMACGVFCWDSYLLQQYWKTLNVCKIAVTDLKTEKLLSNLCQVENRVLLLCRCSYPSLMTCFGIFDGLISSEIVVTLALTPQNYVTGWSSLDILIQRQRSCRWRTPWPPSWWGWGQRWRAASPPSSPCPPPRWPPPPGSWAADQEEARSHHQVLLLLRCTASAFLLPLLVARPPSQEAVAPGSCFYTAL